jgi:hypothetical protein
MFKWYLFQMSNSTEFAKVDNIGRADIIFPAPLAANGCLNKSGPTAPTAIKAVLAREGRRVAKVRSGRT